MPDQSDPDEGQAGARPAAQIWKLFSRPGRGQVIAAVILFLVGLGAATQIRISSAEDAYTNARREDLIQILDGLSAESRRLETEISQLQQTQRELKSGADSRRIAKAETDRRLAELSILAGTVPAHGPGIRLRIVDPQQRVSANLLLNAVEEMRDAGAEVIEINDQVRVVASTWFGSDGNQLLVDGRPIQRPIVLDVIGDPHSLEEGAKFRGGLVSEVTGPRVGGSVAIEALDEVSITSLHTPVKNQYARPASTSPSPR